MGYSGSGNLLTVEVLLRAYKQVVPYNFNAMPKDSVSQDSEEILTGT